MNWLKGLVAPAAQYVGQAVQQQGAPVPGQGMPPQDPNAPPIGGMPNQYGFQQQPMQPMQQPPMQQSAPMGMQGMGGGLPDASQWSTGTRTQGSAQQGGQGGGGGGSISGSISGNTGGKSLEARCAELEHDVASLALFARTLLTMLEDHKVVTREQFMETKNKLDMLDGKIDDR